MKSEAEIYSFWEKENFFDAKVTSKKKVFSLLIPPPNLTGELHLGHAMQHSILDAIARYKRLCGYDVLLLPGVDHAGIQFEGTLDKKLSKENKSKKSLGRERWLEEAWTFKEEIYRAVSESWKMMGLSADWSREVFTLDEGPRSAVYEQFKIFYDKGFIYKGPYIVQWCPKCNTAIEDVEMEYEERDEKIYHVKYKVASGDGFIEVATTRPETIFADTGIALYPNHPRFKEFVGEIAINPLNSYEMPIFEDERIEKDFGTGALKVTPGHDILDYQIGKDKNLPIKQVVSKEGRLTELAGEFVGLKVSEAKPKVVEKLKSIGSLAGEKNYKHSVAVCERCNSVVEPIISEEWFVKIDSFARDAIEVIGKNKIKFLPRNYENILIKWLENIHDWCISRSLWWGHRIPVWYPSTSLRTSSSTRSARSGQVAEMRVSLESPGPGWIQDEQVLDTWFSSGLWPMSILGWPKKTKEFARYFPWDFEISAPDIKYLWIARMIMLSVYFTGSVPFKVMFFHGMLRDLQGRKFSKSLRNGIEPTYLVDKWGVDATRMTLYSYSIPGRDGRVSKGILDERAKNFRNFATKLRNIARFIIDLKPEDAKGNGDDSKSIHTDDLAILEKLQTTTKNVTKNLDKLELHLASSEIYNFLWHDFADIYIEKSKNRREDAQPTLEKVFRNSLVLLHPFMPFVSEELYQKLDDKKKSIMLEAWPSFASPFAKAMGDKKASSFTKVSEDKSEGKP